MHIHYYAVFKILRYLHQPITENSSDRSKSYLVILRKKNAFHVSMNFLQWYVISTTNAVNYVKISASLVRFRIIAEANLSTLFKNLMLA